MEQEQVQEQENEVHILFVLRKDDKSKQLQGVKGVDEAGNLQTFPLEEAGTNEFMQFDKNSSILKNLFKNFWAKLKDPYNLIFFSGKKNDLEKPLKDLRKNTNLEKKRLIEPFNIEEWLGNQEKQNQNPGENQGEKPEEKLEEKLEEKPEEKQGEKQGEKPEEKQKPYIKVDEIPWEKLQSFGIYQDKLQKSGELENMLNKHISKNLLPVKIDFGGIKIDAEFKVALLKDKNNNVIVDMKSIIRQPNLNDYFNIQFTEKDRENLLRTGNLGRVIEVIYPNEKKAIPVYLSIDRLTNRYVSYRATSLRLPDEFSKVKLDQELKDKLTRGEAVYLTNLESKNGKKYNAFVQVSAETKGLAIVQDRLANKLTKEERQIEKIPYIMANVILSEQQRDILRDRGYIALNNITLNGKTGDFALHKPEGKPAQFYDLSDPRNFFLKSEIEKSEKAYAHKHPTKKQSDKDQENNQSAKPKSLKKKR